jgi:glycosyltransferase involved in cell wall biosynthesis
MLVAMFQAVVTYGGSSRSLVEVGRRLEKRRGVEVVVIDLYGGCSAFREAVNDAGLKYEVLLDRGGPKAVGARDNRLRRASRLLGQGPEVLRIAKAAKRRLREIGADVVISNDFRTLLPLCLPGISQARKYVWLRGWWTPDMFTCYCRWMAKRKLAGMLAVSHQTATAVRAAGAPAEKVHVVHNPIDVEDIRQRSQQALLAPLPQMDRPVRLLVPATVIESKGLHTAAEAMGQIVKMGHDAVLWFAGNLDTADRAYVEYVNEIAAASGVAERVEWLGLRGDLPQVMKAATAVVLPTHSEGHPRVSLEAFALRRPFISTPVGGVLDMVLPGVTGLLFEVNDAAGLAGCVDRLCRDEALRNRVVDNAEAYVRDEFTPAQQIDTVLDVIGGA